MKVILFIIGLLLSADGLYYGYTTSMGAGEGLITAFGIIFILLSVFSDAIREKRLLRVLKGIFTAMCIITLAYSVGICVYGHIDNTAYNEQYVIVLGSGLDGAEPSAVLKSRLDKAVEYMNINTDAIAIVSGGQGQGETVSEALAMQNYLINSGIDIERVFTEEQATNTYENFALSGAYVDGDAVFITSEFHVLRSELMARLNGIEASHIGSSTPSGLLPIYCVRELAAQIASIRYYF